MATGLTEDQMLLRESAAKFVRDSYPFETRQTSVASDTGLDPAHWQVFAEMGWLAAPFSEDVGGLGLSSGDMGVLLEELGRGNFVGPYWSSVVFAGRLVEQLAPKDTAQQMLAPVIEGLGHLTVAWMEPGSRYVLSHVETHAEKDGESYVITGLKRLVPWANLAGHVLVVARTSGQVAAQDGISVFAVPTDSQGIMAQSYTNNDGHRASDLVFDKVRVGPEALIGPAGAAFDAVQAAAGEATLALALEAAGCVGALHDQTLDFIKQRQQFGRPIGKFQVVQHAMVDVNMEQQTLQSIAFAAALHNDMDIPQTEKQRLISTAKAQAGWSGRKASELAFQLHGAIAMSTDLPIGHFMKRLVAINSTLGDADHHVRRFQALAHAQDAA